eukprot:TRINITY_DN33508_c0_g1_i2.p1 TRINITY_DN33508_c0_g1~~TRINITY_DN33508_c0_g1_i2.p1  ORF type:complete len:411 (+),score=79.90 TRINITY_DN33508_c0_g1_i2:67-1299(+)
MHRYIRTSSSDQEEGGTHPNDYCAMTCEGNHVRVMEIFESGGEDAKQAMKMASDAMAGGENPFRVSDIVESPNSFNVITDISETATPVSTALSTRTDPPLYYSESDIWNFLVNSITTLLHLNKYNLTHGGISLRSVYISEGTLIFPFPSLGTKCFPSDDVFSVGLLLNAIMTLQLPQLATSNYSVDLRFLIKKMCEESESERPKATQIANYHSVKKRMPRTAPPTALTAQPRAVESELLKREIIRLRNDITQLESEAKRFLSESSSLRNENIRLQDVINNYKKHDNGSNPSSSVSECDLLKVELKKAITSYQQRSILPISEGQQSPNDEVLRLRELLSEYHNREADVAEREAKIEAFLRLYKMTAQQLSVVPSSQKQQQLFLDYYAIPEQSERHEEEEKPTSTSVREPPN